MSRKYFHVPCLLAAAVLVVLLGAAANGTVIVTNPSFESPVLADGANATVGTVSGWTTGTIAGSAVGQAIVNVQNVSFPNTTYVSPSQPGYLPATGDGLQTLYHNTNVSGTALWLYQDVGSVTVGDIYALTFAEGCALNHANGPWGAYLVLNLTAWDPTNPGAQAVKASITNTSPGVNLPAAHSGTFVDNTITWTANASGDLYIVFSSLSAGQVESGQVNQNWWDNVRLTETATPEPSTLALLAAGLAGLLCYAWRKRK